MAQARSTGLELTPPQKERLNEALRSTFSVRRLAYVFEYRLNRQLDVEFADSYESLVQGVVREAAGEGWVDELVARAREAAPKSVPLRDIAEELGLAAAAPPAGELERLVADREALIAPEEWRGRMGVLETQVCRIEVGRDGSVGMGTGFLVGVDTVMTADHVIQPAIDSDLAPAEVTFRFDYKRAAAGEFASAGTTFAMAAERVVDSSPPAPGEFGSGGAAPTDEQLDYALVKVAGEPGATPVGGDTGSPDTEPRGWIETPVSPKAPPPGRPLFILQHPAGDPIKLGAGPIGTANQGGTRVAHAVNTLRGSSGSPCFDANLMLVAVHHAGDSLYDDASVGQGNRAVPLEAILARRVRRGLSADLGAGP
jgi:Trypsin-like peptidase domain/Effector-associated domain 1